MTVWLAIECTHCHSTEVAKHGKSPVGKQLMAAKIMSAERTFVLSQTYPGRRQQVKQQIVEMTLNGRA